MKKGIASTCWSRGRDPHGLPRVAGLVDCDIAVVGLGGTGLSVLEELRALLPAARLVGVDRSTIAAGAAGGNGGFLLAGMHKFHHDAIAWLGRSCAATIYTSTLQEMARQEAWRLGGSSAPTMRRVGSLRIASTAGELDDCRAHYLSLKKDKFPAEWYRGPEGEGVLVPSDGSFHPVRHHWARARRLLSGSRAAGTGGASQERSLRLFGGFDVPSISPETGVGVMSPSGTIELCPRGGASGGRPRLRCRQLVIAVDGKLDSLVPALQPDVYSVRLQMASTAPTSDVTLPRPVYRRWGYDYWQQLPDRSIAIGGFRDRLGDAENTHSTKPTSKCQRLLDECLRNDLKVAARVTHRWAASVGFTKSELPVLDEVYPAVWAVGAFNGTGNIIGSCYGRALAEKIATGRSSSLFTTVTKLKKQHGGQFRFF